MQSADEKKHLSDRVLQMLQQGRTQEEAEAMLTAMDLPLAYVKELVAETMKLYLGQQRSRGLSMILTGAVMCFASFLLTLLGVFPEASIGYYVVLYGLTGAGAGIAFYGFTHIF
ncbi:hypothetical protein GCM10023093_17930 [Nemorincola caseinilytica]|uniref:DUF2157 domain-containing protein n=1 Tax=Nemorincola caseinilytica TaxID=2054315 RepID=A0ABP8NE44_9BACT